MVKYDLLVYLGFIPVFATIIVAAFVIWATPLDADPEVRKIRGADATLVGLLALFPVSGLFRVPRHAATGAFHLRCESRATSIEKSYFIAPSARLGGGGRAEPKLLWTAP
jgi:hypothetical protein